MKDVCDDLLCEWPLPAPADHADKLGRGRVLIVAGNAEMAGAAILAGTAALRAGAGHLTVLTAAANVSGVSCALPEARVVGSIGADIDDADAAAFDKPHDAILVGPGLHESDGLQRFVLAILARQPDAILVLDAGAIPAVRGVDQDARRKLLITPHAGELAHLEIAAKDEILEDLPQKALLAAEKLGVALVLKASVTHLVVPGEGAWCHDGGNVGLATSGSGDVLAGLIVGLAARGASMAQAAVWGVVLHARAGDALVARIGPLGYLAREIAGEVPGLLRTLGMARPGLARA